MVAIVASMNGVSSWFARGAGVCALAALFLMPFEVIANDQNRPFYEKLPSPPADPFFVEASAGLLPPLTSLDNPGDRLLNIKTDWSLRLPINLAGGMRVWDPLNLDVGLRMGISFQSFYNQNSISHSYDTSIRMVEVVPFGRATLFPFNTETWGLSAELGLGFLIPYGGVEGSTDFPKSTQLAIRVRTGLGTTWRFDAKHAVLFHLHALFDMAATAEWQDKVGHQVSLELSGGYQLRF
jgi:hypothetical protein